MPPPKAIKAESVGKVAPGRFVFNVRHVILITQTTLSPAAPSVGAWMSAILFPALRVETERSPGSKTCPLPAPPVSQRVA